MKKLGLYIHIPFCNSICSYCDFYSYKSDEKDKDSYKQALINAIAAQPFGKRAVDSIYFGGGTPTTMGSERLVDILNAARKAFMVDENTEITLEANPESSKLEDLIKLKKAGFNRVSFGVQSAVKKELDLLGRIHTVEEAKNAVLNAKKAGFEHISVDLMLGIPYQTIDSVKESIKFLTSLPVDHISAYMLSVEEGTPLAKMDIADISMNEQELSDGYSVVVSELYNLGFAQYEISNFSKSNGESKHNLKYWLLEDYLGIGPSAHSLVDGKRFDFPGDTEEFNAKGWDCLSEPYDGGDYLEYAMLRLRLNKGLNLKEYENIYPKVDVVKILEKANNFKEEGYLTIRDNTISLTTKGFLISNYIIAELIL